jgi:hypothetical protein
MAEETVDEAINEFGLQTTGKSQTDHIKLLGGHAWTKTMYIKLIQQFGLETDVAKHLAESYGDQAWTVASMANPTGKPALCSTAPLPASQIFMNIQVSHGPSMVSGYHPSILTSKLKRGMPAGANMHKPPRISSPVEHVFHS